MAKPADDYERAKTVAFRLLGVRARSRAELQERLEKKGFPAPVIENVLTDLAGMGLINDEEFARAWVNYRTQVRPAGARALTWELRRHGVDDKLAAAVVKETVGEEDELRLATDLARNRLRRLRSRGPAAPEARRDEMARINRFLAGRGFSYDVIRQAINTIYGEEAELEP